LSGALWAALSGVGFGVFQAFNRRAVQGMDVYVATFLQLLVSVAVLLLLLLITASRASIGLLTGTAVLYFALAGTLHFFIGWTFLNASQKNVGSARTSSLVATIPIFGAAFAAVTLAELPTIFTIVGMLFIIGGVYLVNDAKIQREPVGVGANVSSRGGSAVLEGHATGLRSLRFGLAAALCWSLSPIFIRQGLGEIPDPLLGVTVGMVASALGYAVVIGVRGSRGQIGSVELGAVRYKIFAAVLVALATWLRWVSLELTTVAIALALSLMSVPVVNILAPLVSGQELERVTGQVWLGSGLIIAGSLVLIFTP
jgi:drug/metabolite transporter (DMT)-like permease